MFQCEFAPASNGLRILGHATAKLVVEFVYIGEDDIAASRACCTVAGIGRYAVPKASVATIITAESSHCAVIDEITIAIHQRKCKSFAHCLCREKERMCGGTVKSRGKKSIHVLPDKVSS